MQLFVSLLEMTKKNLIIILFDFNYPYMKCAACRHYFEFTIQNCEIIQEQFYHEFRCHHFKKLYLKYTTVPNNLII